MLGKIFAIDCGSLSVVSTSAVRVPMKPLVPMRFCRPPNLSSASPASLLGLSNDDIAATSCVAASLLLTPRTVRVAIAAKTSSRLIPISLATGLIRPKLAASSGPMILPTSTVRCSFAANSSADPAPSPKAFRVWPSKFPLPTMSPTAVLANFAAAASTVALGSVGKAV